MVAGFTPLSCICCLLIHGAAVERRVPAGVLDDDSQRRSILTSADKRRHRGTRTGPLSRSTTLPMIPIVFLSLAPALARTFRQFRRNGGKHTPHPRLHSIGLGMLIAVFSCYSGLKRHRLRDLPLREQRVRGPLLLTSPSHLWPPRPLINAVEAFNLEGG